MSRTSNGGRISIYRVSGGGLVTTYTDCAECVWEQAKPWNGEDA